LKPLEKKKTPTENRFGMICRITLLFEIQRPSDRALQRIADARLGVFTPLPKRPVRADHFLLSNATKTGFGSGSMALTARIENEESFIPMRNDAATFPAVAR